MNASIAPHVGFCCQSRSCNLPIPRPCPCPHLADVAEGEAVFQLLPAGQATRQLGQAVPVLVQLVLQRKVVLLPLP